MNKPFFSYKIMGQVYDILMKIDEEVYHSIIGAMRLYQLALFVMVYHFDRDPYIPAYVFRPKQVDGKLPAAVLTPGRFQPKDDPTFIKLGVALAEKGFVTICMDRIERLGL